MDQLIKSELFHTKENLQTEPWRHPKFQHVCFCVCVLKGFPTIFVRISSQEIRFSPQKKGSESEKNGIFSEALIAGLGEEEVYTLR